jgi:hypothetical protein
LDELVEGLIGLVFLEFVSESAELPDKLARIPGNAVQFELVCDFISVVVFGIFGFFVGFDFFVGRRGENFGDEVFVLELIEEILVIWDVFVYSKGDRKSFEDRIHEVPELLFGFELIFELELNNYEDRDNLTL